MPTSSSNQWQSFRTRQNRELDLKSAEHTYDAAGRDTIAVKVIDIFGNDTMTLIKVTAVGGQIGRRMSGLPSQSPDRYHRVELTPVRPTATFDPYKGSDPGEIPVYSIGEAAHYLSMPVNTVRSWVSGRCFPARAGHKRAPALVVPADPASHSLSFINLLELHVLAAIRRHHQIQMPKVRKALSQLEARFRSKHPLVDQDMLTDGTDLFAEQLGSLVNLSRDGQLAMREILTAHLKRIERDAHGLAIRLYPFTRPDGLAAPKFVVIDPRMAFGRPVISGSRIPTTDVFERFKAGDSLEDLVAEYGRKTEEIQEAIRYEAERAA